MKLWTEACVCFMCAFFPGKKIQKSPVWSMASPNDSQRSRESSLTKLTWNVNRRGDPRIQVSWPTVQGSWSLICFCWKYLKIKHNKALERREVERSKLKSFFVRLPETLNQYKLPWGNDRYYLLTTWFFRIIIIKHKNRVTALVLDLLHFCILFWWQRGIHLIQTSNINQGHKVLTF